MGATETAFIGLGSNLGDSARTLWQGWELLGEHDGVMPGRISSPFLSAPVGMDSSFWFTNAVGFVQTTHSSLQLLDILLDIEQRLGRMRSPEKQGYQDRTLDLDLLYFGSETVDMPRLTVPHPFRNDRLFVLAPMAEIAPDWIDPETGTTVAAQYQRLLTNIEKGAAELQEITKAAWE